MTKKSSMHCGRVLDDVSLEFIGFSFFVSRGQDKGRRMLLVQHWDESFQHRVDGFGFFAFET